jgi:hypothetical protein
MASNNGADDYMSDAFLQSLREENKTKPKPPPKQHDPKKLTHNMKPQEVKKVMLTRAKEALSQNMIEEAEEDDKGYKMLLKMGFEHGKGLGKTNQGIQEPISIKVELDRLTQNPRRGLAHQVKKIKPTKPHIDTVTKKAVEEVAVESMDDFRERMKQRYIMNRNEKRKRSSDSEEEISSSSEDEANQEEDVFGFGKFMSDVRKKNEPKKKKKKKKVAATEENGDENDISYALDFDEF